MITPVSSSQYTNMLRKGKKEWNSKLLRKRHIKCSKICPLPPLSMGDFNRSAKEKLSQKSPSRPRWKASAQVEWKTKQESPESAERRESTANPAFAGAICGVCGASRAGRAGRAGCLAWPAARTVYTSYRAASGQGTGRSQYSALYSKLCRIWPWQRQS